MVARGMLVKAGRPARGIICSVLVLLPGVALAQGAPSPAACERLASLSLPNATITLAQVVNAGAFTPPVNPATRRRRLVGAGGHAWSCSGRAGESDRQHGRSRPWVQRRPRHSAIQRPSGVLPRCGNAEAIAFF